jgi:hypothetical protein
MMKKRIGVRSRKATGPNREGELQPKGAPKIAAKHLDKRRAGGAKRMSNRMQRLKKAPNTLTRRAVKKAPEEAPAPAAPPNTQ